MLVLTNHRCGSRKSRVLICNINTPLIWSDLPESYSNSSKPWEQEQFTFMILTPNSYRVVPLLCKRRQQMWSGCQFQTLPFFTWAELRLVATWWSNFSVSEWCFKFVDQNINSEAMTWHTCCTMSGFQLLKHIINTYKK